MAAAGLLLGSLCLCAVINITTGPGIFGLAGFCAEVVGRGKEGAAEGLIAAVAVLVLVVMRRMSTVQALSWGCGFIT